MIIIINLLIFRLSFPDYMLFQRLLKIFHTFGAQAEHCFIPLLGEVTFSQINSLGSMLPQGYL